MKIVDDAKHSSAKAGENPDGVGSRFHRLIEHNDDAILVVDPNGTVLFVNQAAEIIWRKKRREIVGQEFGLALDSGKPEEIDIISADGNPGVGDMRVMETLWEDKPALLVAVRDITDRKNMEEKFRELQQQQMKLKDQFFSNVSHEMRTPIAVIHQYVTLFLDGLAGNLTPDQTEYMAIILENATQLQHMIADLLDVTRAGAGNLRVDLEPVSVSSLIQDIVSARLPVAEKNKCHLSFETRPDLALVHADRQRIRQVLVTLINNAIKFTSEGGNIIIKAGPSREEPERICISVADTGCGISEQDQKKIFDYFHQANRDDDLYRQGLGLGLFICKEIIFSHGGRIWVESEPGRGSTFFFTLPVFR